MIERLAKKIGYDKVRAIAASSDPIALKGFAQKTGMKVKIYVSRSEFIKNNIEAVPVTIVKTIDGKELRFDGFTENFENPSAQSVNIPEQQMSQGQGKCSTANN